ncbi:MAG: methyltransferase, partial [Verrucomicrobia bacterium]|nr:methyltransferase [Verrucomicrobiota bacterium]
RAPENSVAELRALESQRGIATADFYRDFSRRVAEIKTTLLALLADLRARGHTLAAYGASAKGSTLLNYVQPPDGTLAFIADRSTVKQGRLSPGLHLPIVSPEELLARQPAYTLLLTWNFADEILAQQADYRARGGNFIVPIPEVKVV